MRAISGKGCCEIVYVVRAFIVCGPTTGEWVGNYEGVKATVGGCGNLRATVWEKAVKVCVWGKGGCGGICWRVFAVEVREVLWKYDRCYGDVVGAVEV